MTIWDREILAWVSRAWTKGLHCGALCRAADLGFWPSLLKLGFVLRAPHPNPTPAGMEMPESSAPFFGCWLNNSVLEYSADMSQYFWGSHSISFTMCHALVSYPTWTWHSDCLLWITPAPPSASRNHTGRNNDDQAIVCPPGTSSYDFLVPLVLIFLHFSPSRLLSSGKVLRFWDWKQAYLEDHMHAVTNVKAPLKFYVFLFWNFAIPQILWMQN